MNYRIRDGESLILMSQRSGAPYQDRVEQGGRIIIYEGHDQPRKRGVVDPKKTDQPQFQPSGKPTQNGLFAEAARRFKDGIGPAERVRVFEKIRNGIWAYNGVFELIDSWQEKTGPRKVFKFRLQLVHDVPFSERLRGVSLEHDRVIPSHVKLEVWKRDKGRCVKCGSAKNLHFDHIIPYSLGGSSKDAENIQLLCARHNLEKHDAIQ
ncbi:MAG: HNH endonuclease [Acidobacteriia bacterium]|nr:HNH endonuclease [Terriglobia bacterium]